MHSTLSNHLGTNNMLIWESHVVRKGIFIENAAFRLTDSVFGLLNQSIHVGGISCGLAKVLAV